MPFTTSGRGYMVCECDEAQEQLSTAKEVKFAIEDMKIQIETLEAQIENEKNKAVRLVKESLGRRFSNRTFETFKINYENEGAYETCLSYTTEFQENNGEGLILYGSVGTGKTHLVAAIAHKIIEEYGIPVVLKTAVEMFSELRNFEEDKSLKYKTCDLLIIDDLGKEKVTDWNREKLFEIINYRYEEYLPTIITTNLPPREWENSFGDAVFSRMCEGGKMIGLVGEDRRKHSK